MFAEKCIHEQHAMNHMPSAWPQTINWQKYNVLKTPC